MKQGAGKWSFIFGTNFPRNFRGQAVGNRRISVIRMTDRNKPEHGERHKGYQKQRSKKFHGYTILLENKYRKLSSNFEDGPHLYRHLYNRALRKSNAFRETITVERDIKTAATAGSRRTPLKARAPAAKGRAAIL